MLGGTSTRDAGVYIVCQIAGGCVGAMVANLMFELAAVNVSTHDRSGSGVLARRARRDVRPPGGDPRRRAFRPRPDRGVRGRWLHHGGVLVHVVDQLREPGRHHRAHAQQHVRRHRTRKRPAFIVVLQIIGALAAVALIRLGIPTFPASDIVVPHARRAWGRPPCEGATTRRSSPVPLPLRAQRRAEPDGARLVRAPRGRSAPSRGRAARSPATR